MSARDTVPGSSTAEDGTVYHKASTEGISLLEGEQMLENLHPSWEAWWWQLLFGSLLFPLGVISLISGGTGGLLLAGVAIFGYVAILRYRSRFFITDERVIQRTGLLRRTTNEVRIENIENLKTDADIPERILGHGQIIVSSSATFGSVSLFALPDHKQIANTIREKQR